MNTPKPLHTNPLWKRVYVEAIQGLVVSGVSSAQLQSTFEQQREAALIEAPPAGTDLGTRVADPAPVPDFHDEGAGAPVTVQDLLVEEAALIADAAVRLIKHREELGESAPGRAETLTDRHAAGRRAPGRVGSVQAYGQQPKR